MRATADSVRERAAARGWPRHRSLPWRLWVERLLLAPGSALLLSGVVAEFVRHHAGEPLAEGELLLRYWQGQQGMELGAESFFFQEGREEIFARAAYGELRVGRDRPSVLTGFRDAELQPLGREEKE